MAKGGVDQAAEVERLYGLPLDEFTAERDAMAKRIRADGDRDAADAIRKLRKPSAAAASINRAVRSNPNAAERLLETGNRLEEAQAAAIAGSPGDLRSASNEHADAIAELMKTVSADLGASKALADRARETLRAVAADPELRAQFATGTLVREAEAVGFGVDAIASAPAKPTARKSSKGARKPEAARSAAAETPKRTAAQRKRAERELARAERDRKAAEREVDRAERRLARAETEVGAAEGALAQAADQLADADAALKQAREAAAEPDP